MTNRNPPDALPPQDVDAEQAVLGSALLDNRTALEAIATLKVDDFFRDAHKRIFSAIKTVASAGDNVDLITVIAVLRQEGVLEETGGSEYLMGLINEVAVNQLWGKYAGIISSRSLLRRMITLGAAIQEQATANPRDADALLAETVTSVLNLADQSNRISTASVTQGWEEDAVTLHTAINQPYGVTAARSGIPALDRATGGYGGMYLVVMMSEQKAGKTTFSVQTALASAQQFAQQDDPPYVLVAPLEEGRDSWVRLACCWLAHINSELTLPGRCPDDKRAEVTERIADGHAKLRELPIMIADRVKTTDEIISTIQVEQHKHPLGLIVVDYLQRLSEGDKERESLTQTARALQSASEDTKSPLLLSSQMSWNEATGAPLTYGSRGGIFDASLVMSLKRDIDEDKRKKDTGVIRCQWARSIPEFGDTPFWIDYKKGAHFYDGARESDENTYGTRLRVEKEENGPSQDH